MQSSLPPSTPRARLRRGPCLALLTGGLVAGLSAAHAAPSLQTLAQAGTWPGFARGDAYDIQVAGNYAYVGLPPVGLVVFDVSDPTNCVRVCISETGAYARGVALSGNYAYVTDLLAGLQVVDVSNPANCVRVGGCYLGVSAEGVVVSGNYAYVSSPFADLLV